MTYRDLVAAANSGDTKARAELAIVESRMLNEGVARYAGLDEPIPADEPDDLYPRAAA
ncbi:hypothetical protein SVA_0848 [Sulfurifustis variabilis]|uniref:Uncharacterized protein n=1 Tax=Sulfurifustis variabilis TaxID=1675686 RepID=A0A1B4VD66_9GAMM|nr:hypothetical protein [Sulfurifustis variabilis]BAU47427.1 hypothetical protein SVA_0848 [Sulfurifustis variabilis]